MGESDEHPKIQTLKYGFCITNPQNIIEIHCRNPQPKTEPIEFFKRDSGKDEPYHYFDITNHGIEEKINPNRRRMEFWNGIFDAYSVHWQTREFNLNSLAVKIPLLMLALLLTSIAFCKGINMCLKKNRKSMAVHH